MDKRSLINSLIKRVESGKGLSDKTFIKVVGQDRFKAISCEWQSDKKSERMRKPASVKQYEKLVTKACLYAAIYERLSSGYPRNTLKTAKYAHKVDSAFEKVLEYAREATTNDNDFPLWLDRNPLDFHSPDPRSIPRVIGGKSAYCLNKAKHPYPKLTKREFILMTLQRELDKVNEVSLEAFMKDKDFHIQPKKLRNVDFSGFKF